MNENGEKRLVPESNTEVHRRVKILLAEDNEDDVVIIKDVFKTSRLINIIDVVPDGIETLAYLRGEGVYKNFDRPDILIMDINMPKKNGLEVLEELKGDPKLRSLPVVIMTSSERGEDICRSYEQGACTYIVKPLSYQRFVEVANTFSFYWGLYASVPSRDEAPRTGGDKTS